MWQGNVHRLEENGNAYRFLVGKSEERKLFGKCKPRWDGDNVKMDHKK